MICTKMPQVERDLNPQTGDCLKIYIPKKNTETTKKGLDFRIRSCYNISSEYSLSGKEIFKNENNQ